MLRCGAKQAGLRARTQLLEQPRGAGALAPPRRPLRLEPADALGVERRPQHRLRVAEPRRRLKVEPEQRGEQRVGGAQLRGERGVLAEPPQQVAPGAQHAPQGARLVALQRRAQPARRRGECGQLRHPRRGGRRAGREHLRMGGGAGFGWLVFTPQTPITRSARLLARGAQAPEEVGLKRRGAARRGGGRAAHHRLRLHRGRRRAAEQPGRAQQDRHVAHRRQRRAPAHPQEGDGGARARRPHRIRHLGVQRPVAGGGKREQVLRLRGGGVWVGAGRRSAAPCAARPGDAARAASCATPTARRQGGRPRAPLHLRSAWVAAAGPRGGWHYSKPSPPCRPKTAL